MQSESQRWLDWWRAMAILACAIAPFHCPFPALAQSGGASKNPTIGAISLPKKVTILWDDATSDYVATTKVESDPFKISDAGSAGNPEIIFSKDASGVGSIKMFSENADGKFAVPVSTGDKRTDKRYIVVVEVATGDLAGAKSAKSVGATLKADPTKLDATLKIATVVISGITFELEKSKGKKGGGGSSGGGGNNGTTGGGNGGGGSKGGGGNSTAGGGNGGGGSKSGSTQVVGGRLNFRSSRQNILAGGQSPSTTSIRLSLRGSRTSPLK